MSITRNPGHPVESIFLERWSTRAYDASAIPASDVFSILEAARWAPSAFNIQPWRFLYSHRDDSHWLDYLALLDPFNAGWAQHSSALIFVLSDTIMPGDGTRPDKPSRYNSFDTGAAWAQLALQATRLAFSHPVGGQALEFDSATPRDWPWPPIAKFPSPITTTPPPSR